MKRYNSRISRISVKLIRFYAIYGQYLINEIIKINWGIVLDRRNEGFRENGFELEAINFKVRD